MTLTKENLSSLSQEQLVKLVLEFTAVIEESAQQRFKRSEKEAASFFHQAVGLEKAVSIIEQMSFNAAGSLSAPSEVN